MPQDRDRVDRFLPLKPFVLDVLLELADGKRHGWSLIRDLQQRDGGERSCRRTSTGRCARFAKTD